jgi:3-oxoacyl-[acyl-carrier-protein] synthase III
MNARGSAYITAAGSFLPGDPVPNDRIEEVLGTVGGVPSRIGRVVLRANGIKTRHYARCGGRQTHLNEELAALAVGSALDRRGVAMSEVDMLAVATTVGDVLMPGFASMVHGRLGGGPMEVLSASGVCASGVAALKAAAMAVKVGEHRRAVAAASELASALAHAERFADESVRAAERSEVPVGFGYFNAEFLRWMLSDGAGAVVIEPVPAATGLSLRVDWIELTSYAHALPTCMYFGASDPRNVAVGNTWLSVPTLAAADEAGMMMVRQDTELLGAALVDVGIEECRRLIKTGRLDVEARYDWFLPHISSFYFYDKLAVAVREAGLDLPPERWFTNLATRGNVGSASMYLMLDDALNAGLFRVGDRILVFVPESGRFIISFMQLTVVDGDTHSATEEPA